jgi:hypothetical protein
LKEIVDVSRSNSLTVGVAAGYIGLAHKHDITLQDAIVLDKVK